MPKKYRAAILFLVFAVIVASFAPVGMTKATTVNDNSASYLNYSIEQLQSLIAKLQARLEELKKNAVPCFVTNAELSLGDGEGSETADVRRLQDFLREKGFFKLKSTGWFGKITRASIIAFQKENGLEQSGVFDAATKAKAHSLSCMTLPKLKAVEQKKNEAKNETKKEAPKKNDDAQDGAVTSISMTVNGSTVNWTTAGRSKNGFKVVWSKNAGPTYPTRDGDQYVYLSEPSASSTTIEPFDGPGAYHVRVCEYLGGACGVYSNEAVAQL